MASDSSAAATSPPPPSPPLDHSRKQKILGIVGIAQLMVVLDVTIVNVALPSAQASLGFDDEHRQWVITAYALAFGSLLLLGGRLGDLFGRRNVFITGLLGFAGASALGGAAGSLEVLVAARALQGVFAALLAPAALSILATTFTEPAERARAFGIFGAIAGGGAAIGLLLGGILTEWISWRWCLYVNLLFALPAAFAGFRLLVSGRPPSSPGVDIPGTLLATSGLFLLVLGFSEAEINGWGSAAAVGSFIASPLLLIGFVLRQRAAKHPLLPMSVVLDRARGGAYLAMFAAASGMFALFLFLTYFLQQNLGFSPLETGLAFLPMTASIVPMANLTTRKLLPAFGPRPLVVSGLALGGIAAIVLSTMEAGSSYSGLVLPALIIQGAGMGMVFATAFQTGTFGVSPMQAGVASAMVSTSQQIGGSVGTAALSTIAASAATDALGSAAASPAAVAAAAVDGYAAAFSVAAIIFFAGAVLTAVILPGGKLVPAHGGAPAEPVAVH